MNREEGAQISSKNTESTEYYLGEILHSLLNLILISKKEDFNEINQNVIETSIDNKICQHGGQGVDSETIIDLPFKQNNSA